MLAALWAGLGLSPMPAATAAALQREKKSLGGARETYAKGFASRLPMLPETRRLLDGFYREDKAELRRRLPAVDFDKWWPDGRDIAWEKGR